MSSSTRSRAERSRSSSTRAVLVRVHGSETSELEVHRSLLELSEVLATLGITVGHQMVQSRSVRSSPTYLGEGKLREVAALTGGPGEVARGPAARAAASPHADDLVVVVDDELTPGQQRNLELALGRDVLDRTGVILRVFEARARTPQARMEVELARLEYELPRIRDDRSLGDREGGGGRASRGHSNVELAKQRIRDRIAAVRRALGAAARTADETRAARSPLFRVALVGYTNAGKSSLMQALTGADVLIEDRLFATLGTTVRQLAPPARPPVVVADTVGFLDRLPHSLVASFRSTLSEALEAWLVVHVADASDPHFRRHIAVTEAALREVGAGEVPALLVLNKADRLDAAARRALQGELPGALVMSALDPGDGERLRARIDAFFARHLVERQLTIPYAQMGILSAARDHLCVLEEEFADAVTITVRGTEAAIAALEAKLRASGEAGP